MARKLNPHTVNPIISVESAENGMYRGVLRSPIDRSILRLSNKRLSYGLAFAAAAKMAEAA
jgi:chorismate mutase